LNLELASLFGSLVSAGARPRFIAKSAMESLSLCGIYGLVFECMQASATSWKREPFKEGIPLAYRAAFDSGQVVCLKAGLIPRHMEDKWFIYYEEPYLFLHRSWTGEPVYRVTLKTVSDGAEVTEALWSKDLAVKSKADSDYQVRLLDFLVSNLLLGQAKPFPTPAGLTEPVHGLFQHHVSGTGYPQTPTESKKPWWRIF
jgi:hypothetical protein